MESGGPNVDLMLGAPSRGWEGRAWRASRGVRRMVVRPLRRRICQTYSLPAPSQAGSTFGLAMFEVIAQNRGCDLTVDPRGWGRGACFALSRRVAATPA
jgi:hypothetical protein